MSPPARRDAFTLLEVMAAVLVLGMIYTVLAEAAIRGLRSEGISRRRVEASLIADRFLADLEAQLALGEVPPNGNEEQNVDPYHIAISVQPFDPTPLLEAIEGAAKERGIELEPDTRTTRPSSMQSQGAADEDNPANPAEPSPTEPSGPVESLLSPPRRGEDGRLRRIDVAVVWQEGDREERVLRTTYAFDTTGLEAMFPKKDEAAAGADGQDGPLDPQSLDGLDPQDALKAMQGQLDGATQGGRTRRPGR